MTDRTKAPVIHTFPELVIPPQTVRKLANGSTLHVYTDSGKPIVRICLLYEGGMSEVGAAAARVIASQLTEGSADYTADELANIFDYNGVRLGMRASEHHLSLEVNVLGDRLDEVLPAVRSMLVAPTFPADHLEVARMQLCAEVQNKRLQAPAVAHKRLMARLFGTAHPLAHVIDEDEVNALDSAVLSGIYHGLLDNSRLHVYVSGAVDEAMAARIEDFVLSLPSEVRSRGITVSEAVEAKPGEERLPFERSMQAAIAMGMRTIGRSSADYIDLRLVVMALGGYFGSRLMSNIREEKGLTYGIYASLSGGLDGAYMAVSATCDKSYTDTVVAEINKEIKALATNPPKGEELETLKSYALSSLAETLDTPYSIMGYYTMHELVGTPEDYFEAQQRAIRALTPERIASLAAKYLDPGRLHTVIAG